MKTKMFVLGWLLCSIWVYGTSVAFFQTEFKANANVWYWPDRIVSAAMALGGPTAIPAVLILCRPNHGWML